MLGPCNRWVSGLAINDSWLYFIFHTPFLIPRVAKEEPGPPLQSPACRGKVYILQDGTWFHGDTVKDTTPWCHTVFGTIVKTLAWGLFLWDHPWKIVRDCLFSFVSVFSRIPWYKAPLDATRGRSRSPVLGPPARFPKKPMQD